MAATRAFVARRMAGNLRGTRQLTTAINKRKKTNLYFYIFFDPYNLHNVGTVLGYAFVALAF